jgi:ribonucleoside-diphosphate reductase beta chain
MGILGTGIQDGLLLKPVRYQWAMDLYNQAVANTWFPNEIQLGEDMLRIQQLGINLLRSQIIEANDENFC